MAAFVFSFIAGLSLAHQAAMAEQRSYEDRATASRELAEARADLEQVRLATASIPRLALVKKYGAMEKSLAAMADDSAGRFSIGFYDLNSDYQYIYQPGAMPAASVIKLYIMIEAYRQFRDGWLDPQERHELREDEKTEGSGVLYAYPAGTDFSLEKLVELMIIDSDNTAANILIRRLGQDNINVGIDRLGCQDTRLNWMLMTDEILVSGDDNPISCPDLLLTLRKLYNGECVSPELDREMIAIMSRQNYRSRIPAGLPAGTRVANKTGSLSWVVNDAAIVFTERGDYILCVLNSQPYSKEEAEATIAAISSRVYKTFISEGEDPASHNGR